MEQPIFPCPRRSLAWLVVVYLLLSLSYVYFIPLWEARDEAAHFGYVHHVQAHWRAPPSPPRRGFGAKPRERLDIILAGERHQPPLFYWLSAPLLHAVYGMGSEFRWRNLPPRARGGFASPLLFLHQRGFSRRDAGPYVLRIWSVLLGGISIYLTYSIGMILFCRESIAVAGAAMNVLIPSFTRLSATINNDTLAIALSSLSLLGLAAWLRSEAAFPRRPVLVALTAAAFAILTKLTAVSLIPLVIWVLAKKARVKHPTVMMLAVSAIAIAGFAAAYQLLLYRLEWQALDSLYGRLFFIPFLDLQMVPRALSNLHAGWWVRFGWNGALPIRSALPVMLDLAAIIGLIGFVLHYRRAAQARSYLALIPASILLGGIVVLRNQFATLTLVEHSYLYPVISTVSLMVVAGIHELLPAGNKNLLIWTWVPMALINLVALMDCAREFGELL